MPQEEAKHIIDGKSLWSWRQGHWVLILALTLIN